MYSGKLFSLFLSLGVSRCKMEARDLPWKIRVMEKSLNDALEILEVKLDKYRASLSSVDHLILFILPLLFFPSPLLVSFLPLFIHS